MNRPFSAFGVLLSLLAVTMFAVSSTSRSTTVKPAAERAKRAAVRRPVGYPHFEMAVAADAEREQEEDLCTPGSGEREEGRGEREEGQAVQPIEIDEEVTELEGSSLKLAPVQIEAVDSEVSWIVPEPMDGRSLYDAVYDWVVLGSRALNDDSPTHAIAVEPVRELSDSEVTGLFQSFLTESQGAVSGTTQRVKESRAPEGELRAGGILPAFQNWVRHQVDGLLEQPVQNETVEWSDYADLVDSAEQQQSTSADIASISVVE